MWKFFWGGSRPAAALSYREIRLVGAVLSTLLAAVIFYAVWRQEYSYTVAQFRLEAAATAGAVQQILDYSTHDFAAARSLYLASSEVTRDEFNIFISDQIKTNPLPGLLALGWVPYVKAEDRAQFEQSAQADGLENFHFTERDQEGQFVRAGVRSEYYPIYFIAPQEEMKSILGFDLGADATQLAALQRARDTGFATVISAAMLLPPDFAEMGSIIFYPIYEPETPLATVAERRSHLRGFLSSVFHLQTLLSAGHDSQSAVAQNLYLLDPALPSSQQVIFTQPAELSQATSVTSRQSPPVNIEQLRSSIHQVHEVQISDQRWQLLITPAVQNQSIAPGSPLIAGLATFAFAILATAYLARRRQAEETLQKSKEQYRLVVENVSDAIWAVDTTTMKVQFVTPSISTLIGLSVEEVLLSSLQELLGAENAAQVQALMPQRISAAKGGYSGPYVDEFAIMRRDHTLIWVENTSHLATNPWTAQLQMYGIARDVTERRRIAHVQTAQFAVSRILAQSPQLHDAITQVLESLAQGLNWPAAEFWRRNEDGSRLELCCNWYMAGDVELERFMTVSQGYTFVRGDGLAGRTWQENTVQWAENICDSPDFPRYTMRKAACLQSAVGVPIAIDDECFGVMVFHDQTARPVDDRLQEALADLGRQIGQFIARKQAEVSLHNERAMLAQRVQERTADLRTANAELAHALRAKDEFLANMSHELRTPLNGILTLGESLQEGTYGPLNSRQQRSLGLIEQSGYHLLALINDVLDLAKVEAGKLDLHMERVSAQEIMEASLALVQETASKKSIRLTLQCPDQYPDNSAILLSADPRRLKQVLVNLLSNAIKFTAVGGHVALSVTQKPQLVEFAVQDDGIGIPPEEQSKLFQPFTQLDTSLDRHYEGTGLGLALVRRLVELHNGQVSVESSGISGQGSRFIVAIPCENSVQVRGNGQAGAIDDYTAAPRVFK